MPDKAAKNKQNRPAEPREQLDISATMEPTAEALPGALGKLWMEIRSEIQTTKAQLPACTTHTAEPARTGVKLQRAAFEYERERAADPDPRDEEDEIISTAPECAETGPEGSPPQEEP